MANERGQYVPLSLPRKWMADLMYFCHRVPSVAVQRTLRLRPAADARKATGLSVGWGAMIVKAMALVGERVPELRRAYFPYPWPRMYEAPYSVANIIVGREYQGEHATFMSPIRRPELSTLVEIEEKLERMKCAPVEEVNGFRRLIRTSKCPLLLRRALWAIGIHTSGLLRARTCGTFSVNSLTTTRTELLTTRTAGPTSLFYNTVSRDGEMLVQIAFDHRVYDGYGAGRILSELERILNNEIVAELRTLVGKTAAA